MNNPLLHPTDPFDFAAVSAEHVAPALEYRLAQARDALRKIAQNTAPVSWDNTVAALDDAVEALESNWSAIQHLRAVCDTPALREAVNAWLPAVTDFYTWLGQHVGLYERLCALEARAAEEPSLLSPTRRRLLENTLRDFRLNGVALEPADKTRFAELRAERAQASQRFSENVLDATDAFTHSLSEHDDLTGIPDDVLAAAQAAALAQGQAGYIFTLQAPCYFPVMEFARNRSLREILYRAYVTRASEFGPESLDNGPLMLNILQLRHEEAELLGFKHAAEQRLQTRMAQSTDEVLTFLSDLTTRARALALRELTQLRQFARQRLGIDELAPWDIAYAAQRLRENTFDYSEQAVRPYFPSDHVLPGVFETLSTLFSIRMHDIDVPTWHPNVRCVAVSDPQGNPIGTLYLDLYARTAKQSGAWMDGFRSRHRSASGIQQPIAFLTCNFPAPTETRPSLLTHDDLLTLFHEFGHVLHHLLTEVDDRGAAGISGVEWDAVELPSQFMENFCWDRAVLQRLSRHVDTGESLPSELYEKMLAAKNFHSGMALLRQIEMARFDIELHQDFQAQAVSDIMVKLDAVRAAVAVLTPPPYHRFPHSFSHIFAGGYAAGYYSYKWAEVLSADAFAVFEEAAAQGAPLLNQQLGLRFRDAVLARGSSRPALDSFVAFRGRKPTVDALLRHSGIEAQASIA